MLLSAERLFAVEKKERLPAILADSRKYQNLVSTQLAEQVLAALYELLRGFQAADDQRRGDLLRDVLADDPNQVYAGLLTVLLRLVFILYAEDRGLLSTDDLPEVLLASAALRAAPRRRRAAITDTMDHRYGAWAQLLTLFRLIYDGGRHGRSSICRPARAISSTPTATLSSKARQGSQRQPGERTDSAASPTASSSACSENLLILDGERLSYRTLDVEQIGSVYETSWASTSKSPRGLPSRSMPKKAHGGAPVTINLEELLRAAPAERGEWLQKTTGQ